MNNNKNLGTALEKRVVEKAVAAGLNSTKQPGSGVFKDYPSDVVVENILVECKVRSAEFIPPATRYVRIDMNWLEKVREEAEKAGFLDGVVVINAKGSRNPSVLISLDFFLTLLVEKSTTS